jgi:hypothetical protein
MTAEVPEDYWYLNRDKLEEGMVFRDCMGDLVKLDRRVPCDGTQWYVATWYGSHWSYEDSTIEPGDLTTQPLTDPATTKAA